MKRIFLAVLAVIIVIISLTSCGDKKKKEEEENSLPQLNENEYLGILSNREATLVIDGDKAIFNCSYTEEHDDYGAPVKIVHTSILTGIIESNENGVITVCFGKEGATESQSHIFSGEAADAARQEYLSIAEYMEGPMKQAMIDIADGKTVNMAYGDALWDELGQGSSVIIVTFDTESGIFEAEYKG